MTVVKITIIAVQTFCLDGEDLGLIYSFCAEMKNKIELLTNEQVITLIKQK